MTTPAELNVGLIQAHPVPGDVHANLDQFAGILTQHPDLDLAVLPELFLQGYYDGRRGSLTLDSEPIERLRELCAATATATICGFSESAASTRYNSAICIDENGELLATYRKIFLFGSEAEHFQAGNTPRVVNFSGVRVGVMICFDSEFPEMARALMPAKPDLLVTLSANMHPYQANHRLHARARALESRLPHFYVNQVGQDEDLLFIGGSCVVDAGGIVHADLDEQQTGVLVSRLPSQDPYPDRIDYPELVAAARLESVRTEDERD